MSAAQDLTYQQIQVAALLGKTLKTFQNCKPKLFALGLPQPLVLIGNPIWLREDVDAWLKSRRQGAMAHDQPAVDTKPQGEAEKPRKRGRPRNSERGAAA